MVVFTVDSERRTSSTSGSTDGGAGDAPGRSDDAIVVEGLSKAYDDLVAVDDVSFRVRRGELFGFLGPNGSGKTTTMKGMLGLLSPDSGIVTIRGDDVRADGKAARGHVGYLPERLAFYDNLTPVQTLQFFARLRGVSVDARALLAEVGLDHAADRRVGTFSKGMTQLLGLAQAMVGEPSVYVLDEPMSGLDPRWVVRVREKVRALNADGATVFFSSHDLSEVQTLCDRVAIIDSGRLVATDTVTNLSDDAAITPRLLLTVSDPDDAASLLAGMDGVDVVETAGDSLTVTAAADRRAEVVAALVDAGVTVTDVRTREPSLEDAFVELIAESEEAGAR